MSVLNKKTMRLTRSSILWVFKYKLTFVVLSRIGFFFSLLSWLQRLPLDLLHDRIISDPTDQGTRQQAIVTIMGLASSAT